MVNGNFLVQQQKPLHSVNYQKLGSLPAGEIHIKLHSCYFKEQQGAAVEFLLQNLVKSSLSAFCLVEKVQSCTLTIGPIEWDM